MSINVTGRTAGGVVVAAALVLAGCGGSDGGGDTETFCEQVRALEAADQGVDDDVAAAAADFEALIDDAPEELRDDLRIVVDAFTELDAIDENDPAAFELFVELFERPEFVEATENLEQFGVDECGLDPSSDDEVDLGDEGDDPFADGPPDAGELDPADGGELVDDGDVKVTTVPGDPYDEAFWGPIDPGEVSIPGLEQHLDVNYADENWFEGKISGSSIAEHEVIVFALVDTDEAVRLCDALLEYAGPIDPDAVAIVEDNDSVSQLASGTVETGCSPADGPGSAG
jgi:outer membrane murein-binding lipoprotein Lpp